MYSALWRALPGPWGLRLVLILVIAAAVLAALVFWVFPWVDQFVIPQEVTVEQP